MSEKCPTCGKIRRRFGGDSEHLIRLEMEWEAEVKGALELIHSGRVMLYCAKDKLERGLGLELHAAKLAQKWEEERKEYAATARKHKAEALARVENMHKKGKRRQLLTAK